MLERGYFLAGQQDVAVTNHDRDGGEALMQARAPNTQPVSDMKQGAM